MDHCNERCTKDATGTCTVCEALAERDRFERLWFQKEVFLRGFHVLRQWWYLVRLEAPRHTDVVREAHKQCSETLNRTMLALLGVALFCLLTALGSPDKLLLAADSTIKVPLADAPISFFGFIVVAPFLLIVLLIYLHIFYGYWITCEGERQHINQRLIPPIEGIPTLFSLPAAAPRMLTWFIFYWLVPLVLGVITWKAWAFPAMGRPLTYVSGVVTIALVLLQLRRRSHPQSTGWTRLYCAPLFLVISLMVLVTFNPQLFRRPLYLFRVALSDAWLGGLDMRHASLGFANLQRAYLQRTKLQEAKLQEANLQEANLQGANLLRADLQGAHLQRAKLQEAHLQRANLQRANLQEANLQGANLLRADLQGAHLQRAHLLGAHLLGAHLQGAHLLHALLAWAKLPGAKLPGAKLQQADLQRANLQRANLQRANLTEADLTEADLTEADLLGAKLQQADLQGANLQQAHLLGADLTEAKNLTQDQINTACGDENTKLPANPEGLIPPPPCPE